MDNDFLGAWGYTFFPSGEWDIGSRFLQQRKAQRDQSRCGKRLDVGAYQSSFVGWFIEES